MKNRPAVLLYGHDEMLLLTRRLIFEGTGYQASIAQELRQVSQLLDKEHVDLIVLCYSLTRTECAMAGLIAKNRAQVPTLLITKYGDKASYDCSMREVADALFDSMLGPEALIRRVDAILHIKRPCTFSVQMNGRYASLGAA